MQCFKLVQELKRNPDANPFLTPVDPIALNIPEYPEIVKNPMDLGTVEKKILKREYKNLTEFTSDVKRIWDNSFSFNKPGTRIYAMTQRMSAAFETLLAEYRRKKDEQMTTELQANIQSLASHIKKTFEKPPGELSYMIGPILVKRMGKQKQKSGVSIIFIACSFII